MTPEALRTWQAKMGYTYETAAEALGMSRSGYAKMVLGQAAIDRRTALACAAILAGLEPYG
jgi:transcriptional regulator with XRE-family HTH domain